MDGKRGRMSTAGNPSACATRISVRLCGCVGDVALVLRVTDDQASYALRQLRTAGVLDIRREGRVIYYRLAEGFPHQLLEHCLVRLLSITAQEGRHHVDRH